MITEVKRYYSILGDEVIQTEMRSDFKDGEKPCCTGFKRNYRKAKWSKYDRWTARYEIRPRCWKNQRKSRHQYKRIVAIDLYCPFERDECGIVITDAQIDELFYIANTYDLSVLGL